MARVNHKKVKRLLMQKRSIITDRQFFTSRLFAGHLEDIAIAQTRRHKYNRRVHVQMVWNPKDESVIAQTNNASILINAGHSLVTKEHRTRSDRYCMICGLFAHELGHVLFTDFLAMQTYVKHLVAYKWFPRPPVLKNYGDKHREEALWEYAKKEPQNLEWLIRIAHDIGNIIEDGYIEGRMISAFPGVLGRELEFLREQQFKQMRTVTEMIEAEKNEEAHIFSSIRELLLQYAKFGEMKYGEEPLSDKRIQTIFSLISEIDQALMNSSGKEHWVAVNQVLVHCWEYIESFIELCKQNQDSATPEEGEVAVKKLLSTLLGALAGTSSEAEGDTTPVPQAGVLPAAPSNSAKRAATKALAENQTESSDDGSEANEMPEQEDDANNAEIRAYSDSSKKDVSSEETGRLPHQQTERVSCPLGGETTYNDEYKAELYEKAASDIERLLDKMAEKAACKDLENERLRELNEVAQNISYGDIHSGVNVVVNRIADVDERMVDQYHEIATPLISISTKLQKSIIQQLKDQEKGGKQTGLIMGRRLDAHALCRNDGKVFYKNALPNEIPRLSVGLLLDESGSMCSYERSTYARATAIILYDFCQSLNIPVMIYGHSTGVNSVELYSYAEFENIDRDDKYRLMDISARDSNRDGAALRFVAEQLSKRPEEIRILMLISDGQPADTGYYGTAAEEDLRGIKQEYHRKGLLFIAAAIGNDKENIRRIYGDSFLDISDLEQLPEKLTSILKRYIRV